MSRKNVAQPPTEEQPKAAPITAASALLTEEEEQQVKRALNTLLNVVQAVEGIGYVVEELHTNYLDDWGTRRLEGMHQGLGSALQFVADAASTAHEVLDDYYGRTCKGKPEAAAPLTHAA